MPAVNNLAKKTNYQCPICGLHYVNKKDARECENWCRRHQSCNLNIVRRSLETSPPKDL